MVILGITGVVLALVFIFLVLANIGIDIYLWLDWFFEPPMGRKRK